MPQPPAVQLDAVHLRFGDQVLLKAFDLTVAPGEHVCLRGPSGCGKTSLLRIIAGLAHPHAGAVHLFGTRMRPDTVWKLRQRIAWVPQTPDPGDGTLQDQIDALFAFRVNRHLHPDSSTRNDLMDRLHLPRKLLQQPMDKLSGGEKQRCALLLALLLRRPLLLLDEVASALDPENKRLAAGMLAELDEPAIISISHDPHWPDIGERVVELEAG